MSARRRKLDKWRGLVALVRDGVEHGSRAVERIQLETAKRPFGILEHIPPIAVPSKVVHVVFDASVSATHAVIRGVNAVAATAIDVSLDAVASGESAGSGDDAGRTEPGSSAPNPGSTGGEPP